MIRDLGKVIFLCLLLGAPVEYSRAEDAAALSQVVEQLRQQNKLLQEQLQKQNSAIEALNRKVTTLEEKTSASEGRESGTASPGSASATLDKIHLSGEGSVGFYSSGTQGRHPNSEFRVDEARLFLDAAVWDHVYGFFEMNFATSESSDLYGSLGEAYLDFENLSRHWGSDNLLSVRFGRMDVPFGEEYLYRDAIDNPLISHSIMDFWGIDEGIELYGGVKGVNYVFAVQNGDGSTTSDTSSDKSVTLRLSGEPTKWLHIGASAMRTGTLNQNGWSELWVANAVFRPIGSPAVTEFHVDLAQADVRVLLPHGHLHFAGGYARYDDNEPAGGNKRDFWFCSAEGVHNFTPKFYTAARFSEVWVDNGYPLPGQGNFNKYFFGPLTDELWRLSIGLGWRFSDNLVLKTEYSFERGNTFGGDSRDHEDVFAVSAAFKF